MSTTLAQSRLEASQRVVEKSATSEIDRYIDDVREKARAELLEEAKARAEEAGNPAVEAVHRDRADRLQFPKGGDKEIERLVDARVRQWLNTAMRNSDLNVRDIARRAFDRLGSTNKEAEPDLLYLLTKDWRSSGETDRLLELLAELPDRLSHPLNKSASDDERSERRRDSLAAYWCEVFGLPVGLPIATLNKVATARRMNPRLEDIKRQIDQSLPDSGLTKEEIRRLAQERVNEGQAKVPVATLIKSGSSERRRFEELAKSSDPKLRVSALQKIAEIDERRT